MRRPARNIWDTRIQCVCGAITARGKESVEIYASGCTAQVSISPPRIAINPNRLYPIEQTIMEAGRFTVNVMASKDLEREIDFLRPPPLVTSQINATKATAHLHSSLR